MDPHVTITAADLITVKFPRLNKQNTLEENDAALEETFTVSKAYVTETIVMGQEDWNAFTHSFLSDWPFLAQKGGALSLWQPDPPMQENADYFSLTEAERELWKAHVYTLVIEVKGPDRTLYVDPEGYSYARYVGVAYQEGDWEAWHATQDKKKNIKPSLSSGQRGQKIRGTISQR